MNISTTSLEIEKYKNVINSCILNKLNDIECKYKENFEMIDMMKYCLVNDSKKLRSIMILIFAEIFEINQKDILNYAFAIEIVHTYTLIHDDLPALDNDDFRRGKPSAHKKFGEANAILLGDAMQTLAFEYISEENSAFSSTQILKVVNFFAQYIGGLKGIIYGEFLDINISSSTNLSQINKIHLYKTAKLFEFCSMICGILTNCNHSILEYLKHIGKNYGLAFQLLDDYDDFDNDNYEKVNICNFLNRNEIIIIYNNYIKEINANISNLKNFYKNDSIKKLKEFVDQTLKNLV